MPMNKDGKKNSPEKKKTDREIALDIIMGVMEKGEFSHILLRNTLENEKNLEKNSRNFITRISEGTIEKVVTLDYILNGYSKVKVNKMKPVIRNILRMSLYQLRYMTAVPDSAVCNEAVKLAKKRGFVSLAGFVNGILRNIIRNPKQVIIPDEEKETSSLGLSIAFAMPEWIVNHFIDAYGVENTRTILKGMSQSADDTWITVRVNSSRMNIRQVAQRLQNEGIEVTGTPYSDEALRIRGYDNLASLSLFRQGYIQVQNLSSILVGQIADVKAGNICLDVCAAPGGKTLHIADQLCGTGLVTARDISEKKCRMIQENVERSGFENVKVQVWDALDYDETGKEAFDVVIADVPCSGLGVMAGKPDIRHRLLPCQLQELANLSQKILNNVVNYVKHGGSLVFSTCTMNPLENTDIYRWLMKEHGLVPEDIRPLLSEKLLDLGENRDTAAKGYIQIFTTKEMDGFFISKFRKI